MSSATEYRGERCKDSGISMTWIYTYGGVAAQRLQSTFSPLPKNNVGTSLRV